MNRNMKKAFTITELVIVIAVVAILAAVLIPTFSNVIEKANQSNDTVLVRSLNEELVSIEITEGKPQTMHDALTAIAERGYSVEKLTPRSSGDILWEQTSNRFALVDKEGKLVFGDDSTKAEIGYTYWKITSDLEEVSTGEYSYYLADEVDESALTAALSVSTGIDVGNNSNISISYANDGNAQDVIFRTNGGTLTVDGSKDTVSHYGSLVTADVQAVATNSYHEYGTVAGNIKLAEGRVVLENKSEVASVVVTATSLDKIAIEDKSGNNTTVAATDSTVAGNLESVVTGEANVSTDAVTEDDLKVFENGLGTKTNPYIITNQTQLLNISLLQTEGEYYCEIIEGFDFTKRLVLSAGNVVVNLKVNDVEITVFNAGIIDLYGSFTLNISGNGKFNETFDSEMGYLFRLSDESTLNINGGWYIAGLTVVQADHNSLCNIFNGTFDVLVDWDSRYWTLNLIDKSNAKIYVSGGKFYKFNPSNEKTEAPYINFLKDGFKVISSTEGEYNVYQVVPDTNE